METEKDNLNSLLTSIQSKQHSAIKDRENKYIILSSLQHQSKALTIQKNMCEEKLVLSNQSTKILKCKTDSVNYLTDNFQILLKIKAKEMNRIREVSTTLNIYSGKFDNLKSNVEVEMKKWKAILNKEVTTFELETFINLPCATKLSSEVMFLRDKINNLDHEMKLTMEKLQNYSLMQEKELIKIENFYKDKRTGSGNTQSHHSFMAKKILESKWKQKNLSSKLEAIEKDISQLTSNIEATNMF